MYNAVVHDHFANPRHAGVLVDADVIGKAGIRGHGNYMVLYVRLNADVVRDASFQTYGCPAAIAAGSWVSEWIVGQSIATIRSITPEMINSGLGGLPLGKEHCPVLAADAAKDIARQFDASDNN